MNAWDLRPASGTGLVLAGGGAKGAYQIGVVDYFARAKASFQAVAGASIGALNAAMIASSPNLDVAVERMTAVWAEVGEEAAKNGVLVDAVRGAGRISEGLARKGPGMRIRMAAQVASILAQVYSLGANPVLRPEFLESLLYKYVDLDGLRAGMPLWVSVFPAAPPSGDSTELSRLVGDLARAARKQTKAEWLQVNALPDHDVYQALRASAALPLLIPSQQVGDRFYRDGGLADNVPAGALLGEAACEGLIVSHLSPATLWDAKDYARAQILEIRPSASLAEPSVLSALNGLLDFSGERAATLRARGFQDAMETVEFARRVIDSRHQARDSTHAMLEAVALLDDEQQG